MPIPQNAQTIYNYLRNQGLSPNAAAGVLGNIEQESGGNPQAGSLSGGYGLIQWTPGSHYFPGPVGLPQQLTAIMQYIDSNGGVAPINANASTPQEAALYFSTVYERPNPAYANNANREQSAVDVAQAAQSGNWAAGVPTGGGAQTTAATGPTPQQVGQATASVDLARWNYISAIAQGGPELMNQNAGPTTTDQLTGLSIPGWISKILGAVASGGALAAGGPVGQAAQGAASNAAGGVVGEAKGAIGGAEHIAGLFTWILQPVNLLRAMEVVAGAVLLSIGGALYLDILLPGIGGVVGTVASVAPVVGATRAVSGLSRSVGSTASEPPPARPAPIRTTNPRIVTVVNDRGQSSRDRYVARESARHKEQLINVRSQELHNRQARADVAGMRVEHAKARLVAAGKPAGSKGRVYDPRKTEHDF